MILVNEKLNTTPILKNLEITFRGFHHYRTPPISSAPLLHGSARKGRGGGPFSTHRAGHCPRKENTLISDPVDSATVWGSEDIGNGGGGRRAKGNDEESPMLEKQRW